MALMFAVMLTLGGGCGVPVAPAAGDSGPPRIVSLAPSVTETLFALGAGKEVIGVSRYTDYPPQAAKLPEVGTFLTPNLEAIVALRPTLIIGPAESSDRREVRALGAMGYGILMVNDNSIAGIEQSILHVGDRIGRADAARQLVKRIRMHIAAVQERLKDEPRKRVLMVVGHQPMVAVGRGTFLDELLKLAHGDNIADAAVQPWPRLSVEYIIATRPQVILDGQMGSDAAAPDGFWSKYPTIPAVKYHHIYGYPQDPVLHPGPRIWQALEILARLIHPDAFRRNASGASARLSGKAHRQEATQ
ncbi:MAG: ABC transporter substrate-binding protein [Candidatus Binataceae bacterium]